MRNIYEEAVRLMNPCDIDHDSLGSDLYLRINSISRRLIELYDYRENVTKFLDQKNGDWWFDIPFAYTPYWESVCEGVSSDDV